MLRYLNNFNLRKKIINFNKRLFKDVKISGDGIILCEFSGNLSNQVAFSFLIEKLKKLHKSKCIAYQDIIKFSFFKKLKIYIQKLLKFGNFSIYRSFLIDEFLLINDNKKINEKVDKLFFDIVKNLNSKKDLVKLEIDNIHIGDLIYDSFLRENEVPTIDLKDKKFFSFLRYSIRSFLCWQKFFQTNKVKALIVSHTVYVAAIPLRIAAKNNIISYQCNCHNIYKLSKNNIYAFTEFKTYRKDFEKLDEKFKTDGLKIAEGKIKERFEGKVGVDMPYSQKSAFHQNFSDKRVLSNSKKKKILIAAHDFFDAPHIYGSNDIFPDFYEWFQFLKDISKKLDYEWYIKSHRDWFAKTDKILRDFAKDCPQFKVIPSDTSHFQIVREGIDCVLTVYGTISWEYAYFGIPVINATTDNPHILYDFNLHARNLEEYENMILNFDKYKINYDKNNIKEFYLMHNLVRKSDWLLDDFNEVTNKIGYKNFAKLKFYEYFIKHFNKDKNTIIGELLLNFLKNDKEYYLKNKSFLHDNASRLELPQDMM